MQLLTSFLLSAVLGLGATGMAREAVAAPTISKSAMKRRRNRAGVRDMTPKSKPMSRQVRRFIARKGTLEQRLAA
mgnify:CR=1 FL=1